MEHITNEAFQGIWNYYLSLESDLSNTSRYIEPAGQENTYSFEFAKIIILACTEVESVMRSICFELTNEEKGNIGEYKEVILARFPKIVTAHVSINRLGRDLVPFEGWDTGKLAWWDAYSTVKHNRGSGFKQANYINAVSALSALYIMIFYLAELCKIEFCSARNDYIQSDYACIALASPPPKQLPDYPPIDDTGNLRLHRAK